MSDRARRRLVGWGHGQRVGPRGDAISLWRV